MAGKQVILCDCIKCESVAHHDFHDCDNEAHYYVEIHAVDACHEFEGGSTKALVCMECFDAYVLSAEWFIAQGMKEGKRAPVCQGKGCTRYLVRMGNFFDDIQNVGDYISTLRE